MDVRGISFVAVCRHIFSLGRFELRGSYLNDGGVAGSGQLLGV